MNENVENIYNSNEISKVIKECDKRCYRHNICADVDFRFGIVCHVYEIVDENEAVTETKHGGVIEHIRRGCNGYRGSELDPECEATCTTLIPGLEELGITIPDPPRRDYGRARVIRRNVSFEEIMETVGCYDCDKK